MRLVLLLSLAGTAAKAAPILWNRLGSNQQVLNSDYGPNLNFYGGGSWPDVIANPAYVPGVFGNGLTIGPGSYGSEDREHNVVWNNLNQYLNPDRGFGVLAIQLNAEKSERSNRTRQPWKMSIR